MAQDCLYVRISVPRNNEGIIQLGSCDPLQPGGRPWAPQDQGPRALVGYLIKTSHPSALVLRPIIGILLPLNPRWSIYFRSLIALTLALVGPPTSLETRI
jgi:hypothetical protein